MKQIHKKLKTEMVIETNTKTNWPRNFDMMMGDNDLSIIGMIMAFTISLRVYVQTVAPSIVGGDSGELVAEGCTLGTSHPPGKKTKNMKQCLIEDLIFELDHWLVAKGYPLYTHLVYLVVQLGKAYGDPESPPAYYVNLMSCVFGALSAALLTRVIYQLSDNKIMFPWKDHSRLDDMLSSANRFDMLMLRVMSSVAFSLCYAFSPLVWQYHVTAEVFALHNFFVTAILNSVLYFAQTNGSDSSVLAGAFISALALTNQHTSILLVFPVFIWVFKVVQLYLRPKFFATCSLCFFLGLTPYVAMPLWASILPHPGSWGDLTSLKGFIHHLTRGDYGSLKLYSGDDSNSEGFLLRTQLWFQDFVFEQSHICALPFICLGATLLWRSGCSSIVAKRARPRETQNVQEIARDTSAVGRVIVESLVFYIAIFHKLGNLPLGNKLLFGVHQRFWMHPNILMFLFGGVGMSRASLFLVRGHRYSRPSTILISLLLITFISKTHKRHVTLSDQTQNWFFQSYARGVLDALPKNSLLFVNFDQQWTSIRYAQECEGFRRDITSINLSMMSFPWW